MARAAHVSVATVSHVVNDTRYVRAETKDRVLQAIQDLRYVNDPVARSLRTGRSRTVGLVMSAVMNPYFNDVVTSIEAATMTHGYSLLIADHRDQSDLEYQAVVNLVDRRVDGILLQPSNAPLSSLSHIKARGIPAVFVDRYCADEVAGPFDFVGTENHAATAAVIQHLTQHGHRRVGMVSGHAGSSTTDERVAGYAAALEEAGIPFDPALVVCGESDEVHAEQAVHTLLELGSPPTALFSGNNRMTIGIMRALRHRGIVPPDSLALAVFDDFPWADLFRPRLTCARQETEQIGTTSVELLLRRLAEPERARQDIRYDCRFVRRNSCGCR